ncbi:MAG: NlpC/P60 family N-terminal domain-containing protein [Bilophila sp.]
MQCVRWWGKESFVLGVCFALVLGGCASRETPRVAPPATSAAIPSAGMVEDLHRLPQDLNVYAERNKPDRRLLPPEEQARQSRRFDSLFFGPWEATRVSVPAQEAFAIFGGKNKASRPRGWAENLLPWTAQHWAQLVNNANRDSYPSRFDKIITVRPTVLREAPTYKPRFGNPAEAGEGFPFDMFMYSSLPVGMPLLAVHASADGAWLFVENALTSGWVPSNDVAQTDEAFRKRYQNGRYAAVLHDNVPLRDGFGRFVTMGNLGVLLPVEEASAATLDVLVPVRDVNGRAQTVSVRVSTADAALRPLPLTSAAVARLGNGMMGQLYGWGGGFGDRDCSLMLRDLFIPFGLWLPRNSASQAKAWDFVDFRQQDLAEKEKSILREGVPFATLLWLRGHITLYLGEYQGRAVMFHDMWGIRTQHRGEDGRYIIGRAVVTTTQPGTELPTIKEKGGLLTRMRGMSVLR